jgi:hypothetical protein
MTPDTVISTLNFEAKSARWFEDTKSVAEVVDAILDTPLGGELRFAGPRGKPKKATSRAAFREAVATGKDGLYALVADTKVWKASVMLTVTTGSLDIDVRCHDDELAKRGTTILDDIAAIALAVRRCSAIAGLRFGYAAPTRKQGGYTYPRPTPQVNHPRIAPGAVLDLIDVRLHEDGGDAASVRAMLDAARPAGVTRTDRDGLAILTWTPDLGDADAVARAAGAHEAWLGTALRAAT